MKLSVFLFVLDSKWVGFAICSGPAGTIRSVLQVDQEANS